MKTSQDMMDQNRVLSPVVFVLEIDHRPVAALAVRSVREAMEVSREAWFRDELKNLSSDGIPLWNRKTPIKARSARPDEIRAYSEAAPDPTVELDEIQIVYLVKLDATPQSALDGAGASSSR